MSGESEPPSERHPGKFRDAVDEMLYTLSLHGWANESGDVESPTGFFARISITRQELPEVVEAFQDEIAAQGFTDTAALIGHFLLFEDSQGFVEVDEYDDEPSLRIAYEGLEALYSQWAEEDDT